MSDVLFGEDPTDGIVDECRAWPGWESDDKKDREFAQELMKQYPDLDVVEEIRAWRIWMIDHPDGKKVRARARISNWCRNARRYGRENPRSMRTGGPSRTAARTADAFGSGSSERASSW